MQDEVTTEAAGLVKQVELNGSRDDLNGRTKSDLLELAASLGVEKRSSMRKADLVKAIKKAAKSAG
jgi:hypothetical protein